MNDRAQTYKPGDFSLGQTHEWLSAFGRQGGNPELLQKAIEDQELMKRIVVYWKRGAYDLTTSQCRAKQIMAENMIYIGDVTNHFNVEFSKKQLAQLAEIPFTEQILQKCKDTHILFPGYPLTVLEIRDKVEQNLFCSHKNSWYDNQDFAKEKKVKCKWQLIRKNEVPNSFNKTFNEQKELLRENEEVPRACEVVFMAILYKLTVGKYLFPDYCVRCQGLDSNGDCMYVGSFNLNGLSVNRWRDGDCNDYVGLAASWKFQK